MSSDSSSDSGSRKPHPALASAKHPAITVGTPPWGPAEGIVVTALAFVVSQLVAGLIFVLGLALFGWSSGRTDVWMNSAVGQFLVVLVSEGLALFFLWLFLCWRKANWRLVGFQRPPLWRDLGFVAGGFVIYFTLLVIAAGLARVLLHVNLDQKQELGFDNIISVGEKLLTFVSLVILPPFVEETLFRGFMFGGLRKKLPFVWAAVATSLLFAAPHLLESSSGALWIAGIDTFILSMVLCYVREKTGALWAAIAIHMLKNGLAFLYVYIFVTH